MMGLPALFGLVGARLGRGAVVALVASGLVALGGIGFWRGMVAIERIADASASAARRAVQAEHEAAIAVSNAQVMEANLRAATAASEASARAEAEIAGLRATLTELETRNAALPNAAAGGLDRDRVRLLRGRAGEP